jgi:hypothetical protein
MIIHTLNEITQLINKQESDIATLKSIVQIALGESFLNHEKTTIHSHFCIADDYVHRIETINKEIMRHLNF